MAAEGQPCPVLTGTRRSSAKNPSQVTYIFLVQLNRVSGTVRLKPGQVALRRARIWDSGWNSAAHRAFSRSLGAQESDLRFPVDFSGHALIFESE
jgi:hypothetical protein